MTQAMYAIRENLAHLIMRGLLLNISANITLETAESVTINDTNDTGSSTPDAFTVNAIIGITGARNRNSGIQSM